MTAQVLGDRGGRVSLPIIVRDNVAQAVRLPIWCCVLENCQADVHSSVADSSSHSPAVAVALDGHVLYGLWEADGAKAEATGELDACNGHVGPVPANTEFGISAGEVYHYHTTSTPPYTIGCFGPVSSLQECKQMYEGCNTDEYETTLYDSGGNRFSYSLWCPCFQHHGSREGGNCQSSANSGCEAAADDTDVDQDGDDDDYRFDFSRPRPGKGGDDGWSSALPQPIPDFDTGAPELGDRFMKPRKPEDDGDDDDDDGDEGHGCSRAAGRAPIGAVACKSSDCSGHGICERAGCEARCKCSDGWVLSDCSLSISNITMMQGKAHEHRQAMAGKLQNAELERKCNDAAPIPCPPIGEATSELCVEKLKDCFPSDEDLEDFRKSGMGKCKEDEVWCPRDGCGEKGEMICSPVAGECPEAAPFRCKDWKCAATEDLCGSDADHECGGKVLCPDGTCKDRLRDCAKNMTWSGCPPGKIACAQKKSLCVEVCSAGDAAAGLCKTPAEKCEIKTGCKQGLVSCGTARNTSTGAPIVEEYADGNGRKQRRLKLDCRETCKGALLPFEL